jgi:hypothetical protein
MTTATATPATLDQERPAPSMRRALVRPLVLGSILGVIMCLPIFTVG